MELINEFEVSVPIDQAWAVLTDVERIAPCLPGAQLQEIEGDEYRGIVKVKVGPISAQYKGKATFATLDAESYTAVLDATGRDTRGAGNANSTITAQLTPAGAGTHVVVTTDLTVTGKVAQFGRGVLADVSAKLLAQFVENLEGTVLVDLTATAATDEAADEAAEEALEEAVEEVLAEAAAIVEAVEDAVEATALAHAEDAAGIVDPQAAVAAEAKVTEAVRRIDHAEPEAIDLLEHAGSPVLKRLVPLAAAVVVAVVVWRVLRRRR